jgi:hypothetical protein
MPSTSNSLQRAHAQRTNHTSITLAAHWPACAGSVKMLILLMLLMIDD